MLKLEELADKLGYSDVKHLAKTMKEITYNNQPVFKFVGDGKDRRRDYIIVNPSVVYAGDGTNLKGIEVLFK